MGKYEEKQLNYTKDIAHLEEKEHWWGKVFGIGLLSGILIGILGLIVGEVYWWAFLPFFYICLFVIAPTSITMWLYFYLKYRFLFDARLSSLLSLLHSSRPDQWACVFLALLPQTFNLICPFIERI